RCPWAEEYRGEAMVVYGHTPIQEPEWLNNTINIDTGCVFGGRLTALRYPQPELVSLPAERENYSPVRPAPSERFSALTQQQQQDDLLDIEDVAGKRFIQTRLGGKVTIREQNATAALEVMSRFATNPKWLIYLPPTMSPCETSTRPAHLEYPSEAFAYYRSRGVASVVCEEKHMGSRAVVVVCRDEIAAATRFGVTGEGIGVCYTRTGRRFFNEPGLETGLLQALHGAIESSGLWESFQTDWFCLDCELMPWSAKAQELLRTQYAATGAAAQAGLKQAVAALRSASGRGLEVADMLARHEERQRAAQLYVEAYRRYCWPVTDLSGIRLAPFHILATEGHVHCDKDHVWHMEQLAGLCQGDGQLLFRTSFRRVDLTDTQSEEDAVQWWVSLTEGGGEGMVVKPLDFSAKGKRGLLQPAVKCRGREYLR
ncbi:MAG: polynucleotide kinase-phosphatase, partial [bacterium]|nr:polynucleotide kinase-phosphatase [bacterium]